MESSEILYGYEHSAILKCKRIFNRVYCSTADCHNCTVKVNIIETQRNGKGKEHILYAKYDIKINTPKKTALQNIISRCENENLKGVKYTMEFNSKRSTYEPRHEKSKKISNDQELIQSDPTSCPIDQKGNN